jgi:hypothetical protein
MVGGRYVYYTPFFFTLISNLVPHHTTSYIGSECERRNRAVSNELYVLHHAILEADQKSSIVSTARLIPERANGAIIVGAQNGFASKHHHAIPSISVNAHQLISASCAKARPGKSEFFCVRGFEPQKSR